MNKKPLTLGIIIFLAVAVTATGALFLFPYSPKQPPQVYDTHATPQGIQEVVNANNQFAFDFFSAIDSDKNIFYSPYSLSTALAMTYEGANGETAKEMQSVFHFPEESILRPNSAAIYNDINKRNKEYELRTGNALWVQKDYPFLEDYLSTVEKYYGGKASNVDFIRETEKSRQTINTFIEEQTNHKIKDLIPEKAIDQSTRLVLTNAIYFKGTWKWQFDKSKTNEQDFRITPENIIKTPMMHMKPEKASFNYLDNDELQILELPYKGEDISMLILLPKDNLNSIKLSKLNEWKTQMHETHLDAISIPKFKFDTKYFLKDTLSSMGMPTAFSSSADFSGMDGTGSLYISKVIHQAYINVDEEGTEAAAATAVIMAKTSMPINQKIFNADHPFIFLIQERKTGNILFMGKVVNPAKSD